MDVLSTGKVLDVRSEERHGIIRISERTANTVQFAKPPLAFL